MFPTANFALYKQKFVMQKAIFKRSHADQKATLAFFGFL